MKLFSSSVSLPAFLRDADLADAPVLASLHKACFVRGWSDGEIEALLRGTGCRAHVILEAGHICGFVFSRLIAGEGEVLSLGVLPSFRRRGLAQILLAKHLECFSHDGADHLFLEVDEKNEAALRLYRKNGFVEVGTRKAYYDGSQTALVLKRSFR